MNRIYLRIVLLLVYLGVLGYFLYPRGRPSVAKRLTAGC